MSRFLWVALAGVVCSAAIGGGVAQVGAAQSPAVQRPKARVAPKTATVSRPSSATPPVAVQPVVNRYCVSCHNDRLKTGGLSLEKVDAAHPGLAPAVWEKAIRKVDAGMMPPAGAARPDATTLRAMTAALATALDTEAAAHPNPGPSPIHRLNRSEYANAIRDLLALDIDVDSLLPPDDAVAGFDNIAEALGVSSSLLERYLAAAMKIAPVAVGTYADGAVEITYNAPGDYSQIRHVEGLPFGTRGGLLIKHTFPVDGEYLIKTTLWRNNAGRVRGLEAPHQLEILIDGARVHAVTVGTPEQFTTSFDDRLNTKTTADFDALLQIRVPVKAGPREIGVTFVGKTNALDPQKLRPLLSPSDAVDTHGVPRVDKVMVTGPFSPAGPGDTPSRQQVFVCRPTSAGDEEPCARRIIGRLAERAYRRPVTDADLAPIVEFYQAGRKEGSFDLGVERAVTRLLTSPQFLFRSEHGVPLKAGATASRLTNLELASRLSFFLWSSIPDEALRKVAVQGRLSNPLVLDQQVRRMLADERSEALTTNFAGQWLYLRNLKNFLPIADEYPDWDDDLRQGFKRETELLFKSVLHDDRSVLELLTANYTFVNERLAHHYGIPNVYGSTFRRVTVTDENRRGLLGHGSVLTVTSNANRTSPVRRGKWILENLIGTPPPAPPPNVPALADNKDRAKPLTMRAQMEQHRANPACAGCHRLMDPLGLALDNFDAVGGWRIKDAGTTIDAKVQMLDGTDVEGPAGLRRALLRRPELFVQTVTAKLMTYALGRPLEYYDMPTVRAIVRDAARSNYKFSALVMGVIRSTAFEMTSNSARPNEGQSASLSVSGQ